MFVFYVHNQLHLRNKSKANADFYNVQSFKNKQSSLNKKII